MNPDILSLFYNILKDFGVGVFGWGVVIYLIWKLMTNHLKHIGQDIKSIGRDVKLTRIELKENTKITNQLGERVSKIEGKLEILK